MIIGGTDDINLHLTRVVNEIFNGTKLYHKLVIDPQLDMKPKYRKSFKDIPDTFHEHHQSHLRQFLEESSNEELQQISKLTFFGL